MKLGHNRLAMIMGDLPEEMQSIADQFGLGLVMTLIETFPGLELRIPKKLREDHKLRLLGDRWAQALCAHCPGETLNIPVSIGDLSRRELVRQLEGQGLSGSEIALQVGCTQRHVRRLRNQSDGKDPNQPDMFSDWLDSKD